MGFDAVAACVGGQIKRSNPDGQIMGTNLVGDGGDDRGISGCLHREMDKQAMGVFFIMCFSGGQLRISIQDAFRIRQQVFVMGFYCRGSDGEFLRVAAVVSAGAFPDTHPRNGAGVRV